MLISEARGAQIRRMVVTMGAQGAVFATLDGEEGYCPAKKVDVKDTTGAGDAFFAGTVIGQTYGKTMMESCEIGTRLAASVITAERIRAGCFRAGRRAARARALIPATSKYSKSEGRSRIPRFLCFFHCPHICARFSSARRSAASRSTP